MSTEKLNYTLRDLLKYFLKLGTTGFGGPVALVNYMQQDLVEDKKWIKESDFKEGLALTQLAPGPLAAQLGIYIGYIHYGILGATVRIGICFTVLYNGRFNRYCLSGLWRSAMDASAILRDKCICYWHHCFKLLQAYY